MRAGQGIGELTPKQEDLLLSDDFRAVLNAERNYAAFALQLMAPAKVELEAGLYRHTRGKN
jgi:hypothetical protein